MDNKTPIAESMETLFDYLEKFFKTETVIGEPIIVGETTLIPVISVSFGCGGGGGNGKDEKGNDGGGAGVGVGAKITPDAIVVIKGDSVTMLPIKDRNNFDKLVNMMPDIVKKVKNKMEEKGCCKSSSAE